MNEYEICKIDQYIAVLKIHLNSETLESSMSSNTLRELKTLDLVKPATLNSVKLTDRGRMLAKMLIATPLPVMKWIDPRSE